MHMQLEFGYVMYGDAPNLFVRILHKVIFPALQRTKKFPPLTEAYAH